MRSKTFYTDGSCKANGNPNSKGGFGVVGIWEENKEIWYEYQEFKSPTTNNEMELMAILHTLKYIKEKEIFFPRPIIYTDSAYCYNIINNWMYSWERNGWVRPKNQEIKNLDIIKEIFELASLAQIKKVSGHSGIIGNELADKLATGERTANSFLEGDI